MDIEFIYDGIAGQITICTAQDEAAELAHRINRFMNDWAAKNNRKDRATFKDEDGVFHFYVDSNPNSFACMGPTPPFDKGTLHGYCLVIPKSRHDMAAELYEYLKGIEYDLIRLRMHLF